MGTFDFSQWTVALNEHKFVKVPKGRELRGILLNIKVKGNKWLACIAILDISKKHVKNS